MASAGVVHLVALLAADHAVNALGRIEGPCIGKHGFEISICCRAYRRRDTEAR
jgi:hypothetical protein